MTAPPPPRRRRPRPALPCAARGPTLLSLPPELLPRILFHALRPHPTRTWLTPADLAQPSAQHLVRVCRRFHAAFHEALTRFSFFLVNPHASSPAAAATHAHVMPTLARAHCLRELQLFIRPRDVAVAAAVAAFLDRSVAPLRTLHLCCAPPAAGDELRAGDVLPVVTDLVAAIAGRAERGRTVESLSLDCCSRVSGKAAAALVRGAAPGLRRLALDVTFFDDWTVLASFQGLEELRLQNTRNIGDADLAFVLSRLSRLEVLEIHQVPTVGKEALRPLAEVRCLKTIELSRCIGIENDAVAALADIPTLESIGLCYIDVSAATLQTLAKNMGDRLRALSVNKISTQGAIPSHTPAYHADVINYQSNASQSSDGNLCQQPPCLKTLLDTVKTSCPNSSIDFGSSSVRPSHWSARPFEEALRHPTQAAYFGTASPSASSSTSALRGPRVPHMPRQIAFRLRSPTRRSRPQQQQQQRQRQAARPQPSRRAALRPLSCCF